MTEALYRPCAGVVLANAKGDVWLGERYDIAGAWQMPQGGIDPGETPRDAALRELSEETGLRPEAVRVEAETADWLKYDLPRETGAFKGKWKGQRQKWFLMRLTGDEAEIDIDRDHPEFRAWRWATPDEAVAAIVDFKRPVYAAVMTEFAPYLRRREA